MKIRKLTELNINQIGIIININLEEKILTHLFHLGFFRGTRITFSGFSPLRNPLVFFLREYKIALSKEIAENIIVQIC